MKIVIFTVFIYYTFLSNSLKLKSQFRSLNYNFGKFAQTLNSENVENPNFELTRSKIDTEYHDLIKMFNDDTNLIEKNENIKSSTPFSNLKAKESKSQKIDNDNNKNVSSISSIPGIEKELENKGSGSLGVIFTEKLETLKDIFKELKSDT